MKSCVQDERGLTLIELMIVIVVMGIVASMTVPAITSYTNSTRLSGAMHQLVGDLYYARSLASSQRRTYVLRRSGTSYSLVCVAPVATILRRNMPRGVAFTTVDSTRFFAWGLTQPGTITLQQRNRTRMVQLTANGQVTHD